MKYLKKQSYLAGILLATFISPIHATPPWISGATNNIVGTSGVVVDPSIERRLQEYEQERAQANFVAEQKASASALPEGIDEESIEDMAFDDVVASALTMSPEQIVKLRTLFDATQRAAAQLPGGGPAPVSRALRVDLAPGSTPPVIRLFAGFISSTVFLDSSGAPWDIESYSLGNPKAYNIQWNQKDNMLMIQSLTQATVANIMVKLRGLQTPVMLTLIPDQQVIDYRVDVRVPGLGPNAKTISSGLPAGADTLLLDLLNGVAPQGSKRLTVSTTDSQAWLIDKHLFLRTTLKVVSPGWVATVSSADGTNVYQLERTPYVLLTEHGATVPIKITGF